MAQDQPDPPIPTTAPVVPTKPLTRANLFHPEAVKAMGQLSAISLFEHGSCCFWLNSDGQVEIIPVIEFQVDLLPEDHAIQFLVQARYTDDQLQAYLKGRDARHKVLGGTHGDVL